MVHRTDTAAFASLSTGYSDFLTGRSGEGPGLQVAVLTCYRGHVQGISLVAHLDVVCFSSDGEHFQPPVCVLVPPWDLNLVLLALTEAPFEPLGSSTLKNLKLKMVFLVAICSAQHI